MNRNAIAMEGFVSPIIYVHSANISARRKMKLAISNINKLCR